MKYFFSIVLFSTLFVGALFSQKWELIRNENGINVYFRNNKNRVEVKTTQTLTADASTVVSILTDFNNYKNWKHSCKYSKTIKKYSANKYIYYYQTELPWFLKDRDCVLKFTMIKENNIIKTKALGVHGYNAESNNYTRDFGNMNNWNIIPLSNNKVKLINYISFEMNEVFPDWFIKQALDEEPFMTMSNLKLQIQKSMKTCCIENR